MFDPILTQEDKQKISDSVNYKLSPLTAEEQQTIQEQVYQKVGGGYSDAFDLKPITIKQQGDFGYLEKATNLISDATMQIDPLSTNATDEERLLQRAKIDRKLNAQSKIYTYEILAKEQAQKQGKEFKDRQYFANKFGLAYENLTDETINKLYSQEVLKFWNETQDQFGVPSQNLLNNQEFWKNCNPFVYRYLATKRNIEDGLTGWTGEWLRTGHITKADRAVTSQQLNYVIDKDKADELRAFANDRWNLSYALDTKKQKDELGNEFDVYAYSDDNSTIKDVSAIMYNMWLPVANHPLKATGAFVLGALGGLATAYVTKSPFLASAAYNSIFSGIVYGQDTYQMSLSEQLNAIQDKDKTVKTEDVLNDSSIDRTAKLSALLEVGSDTVLLGASQILKPLKNLGAKILSSTFSKTQNHISRVTQPTTRRIGNIASETEKQVSNVARQNLTNRLAQSVFVPYLKDIGITTTTESVTEGLQAYVQRKAVGEYLNESPDVTQQEALKEGIQATKQAITPSAVIGMGFITPKTLSTLVQVARAERGLNNNLMRNAGLEIASNSPLAQQGLQDVNGSLIDSNSNYQSRVYVDSTKVEQALANTKDNYTLEDCGYVFKKKFEKANKTGDTFVITDGEFSQLPQQVRDEIYQISTHEDGSLATKELAQYLSADKLTELENQVNIEQAELIKELIKQREIEKNINEQLAIQSKKTSIEQNNAIARTVSSFISSLAKSLGVDSLELYNSNKIQYKNKQRLNLDTKETIDNKNVTGTYNPLTKVVELNERSDFASVFHETSHWFLSTLINLAKTNEKANQMIKPLIKWSGFADKKINKFTEKEIEILNEKFVAGFIHQLIAGDVNQNTNSAFKTFRSFLSSLKNTSLFQNFNRNGNKAEHIKKGYNATYSPAPFFNIGKHNNLLNQFLSSLFQSDIQSEIQNQTYPLESIIDDINKLGLTDEDAKLIRDSLVNVVAKELEDIQNINDNMTVAVALEMMIGSAKFDEFIGSLKDKLPQDIKYKKEIENYFKKLETLHKNFDSIYNEQKENLAKTKLYKYVAEVQANGIDISNMNLSDDVKQTLKDKGFIRKSKDVDLLAQPEMFIDGLIAIPDDVKQRIQELMQSENVTKEQALCLTLAEIPTLDEQATAQAKGIVREEFIDKHIADNSRITQQVARAHKRLGTIVLDAFNKTKAADKQSTATWMIETLAIKEAMNTRFTDANEKSCLNKASRLAKRRSESLLLGDLQGALHHTRNEFYQNTKAEYFSQERLKIVKSMRALTTFVRKSKKLLQKSYDTDLVKLIEAILISTDILKRKTIINLDELVDNIKQSDATKGKLIEDVVKQFKDANGVYTSWKNMTVGELSKLIDNLESLKTSARNSRLITINGKRVLKEKTIDKAIQSISSLPDTENNLAGVNDETQVAGTTKKQMTIWDKVKDATRSFGSLTKMVEMEFQKLDGTAFGGVWRGLYQIVKDAETAYKKTRFHHYQKIQKAFHKIKIFTAPIECRNVSKDTIECNVANGEFDLRMKGKGTNGYTMVLGAKGSRYQGKTTLDILAMMLHMGTNYDLMLDNNFADNENITNRIIREGEQNNKSEKEIREDVYRAQHEYKDAMFQNWFNYMVQNGYITDEMMTYCEAVWGAYKAIEPQLQQASMEIRGYRYQKEQSRIIKFKGREIEGGYVPALLNKDLVDLPEDTELNFEKLVNNIEQDNNINNTPTFLIDRKKGRVDKPLDLDFDKMVGQLSDVIRYATVMPAIHQVLSIVDDNGLKDILDNKAPYLRKKVLEPWLYSIATMKTSHNSNKFMKILSTVNQRLGVALLIGSIKNTAQQVSNIPTVIIDVGVQNFAIGLMRYAMNPFESRKRMMQESDFLMVREKEDIDGVNEIFSEFEISRKQYDGFKSWVVGAKNFNHGVAKQALLLQKIFQSVLDPIAYEAGKAKAQSMGLSPDQQIDFAEMCVRQSYGSFDISDVPQINRGNPLMKVFAMFGTYFYQMYRLAESRSFIAGRREDINLLQKYYLKSMAYTFAIVAPSIIAEYIDVLFTGDEGDDNEDWYKNRYLWAPTKMGLNAAPFVGRVAQGFVDKYILDKGFGAGSRYPVPVYDTLTRAGDSAQKVYQAFVKYSFSTSALWSNINGKDIKNILVATTMITGCQTLSFAGRVIDTMKSVKDFEGLSYYLHLLMLEHNKKADKK